MGQKKTPSIADMVVTAPPGGFSPDRSLADAGDYPGLPAAFYTPTERARPLVSTTPAAPPTRASVASMLQVPTAALGGFLGGAADVPPEAGTGRRLSAAVTGAARAGFRAPFQEVPTSPAQEGAKRGATMLEGLPGLVFDMMADPTNLVGGDPVSDLGKVALAAAPIGARGLGRLYSRIAEEVLPRLGKSQHANKVRSVLKSFASADEVAATGLEEFLKSKGDAPVTMEELEQHVGDNSLKMRETVRGTITESDATKEAKKIGQQVSPVIVWAETRDDEIGGLFEALDESIVREGNEPTLENVRAVMDSAGVELGRPLLVEYPGSTSRYFHPHERVPIEGVANRGTPGSTTPRMYDLNEEHGEAPPADFYSIPDTVRRRFPNARSLEDIALEYAQLRTREVELADDIEESQHVAGAPKYERYTLPGDKRDYRELLVQMPDQAGPQPKFEVPIELREQAYAAGKKVAQHYPGLSHFAPSAVAENLVGGGAGHNPDFAKAVKDVDKWVADGAITADEGSALKAYGKAYRSFTSDRATHELAKQPKYKSPHWQEPDIVTHVRYDTRAVGGKDALFVEEVQSDWDQAAREKGYKTPGTKDELRKQRDDLIEAMSKELGFNTVVGRSFDELVTSIERNKSEFDDADKALVKQKLQQIHDLDSQIAGFDNRVADQPFKGTKATELGVKRVLLEAADQGLDQVAWTTGKQQAERYGKLLRDVKRVEWKPNGGADGKGTLRIRDAANGSRDFDDLTPAQLKDYLGKENAEKLLAARVSANDLELRHVNDASAVSPDRMVWHVFDKKSRKVVESFLHEGPARNYIAQAELRPAVLDTSANPLTIGSRGMDQQYDETMVAQFNKLGKPYGVRAEKVPMAGTGAGSNVANQVANDAVVYSIAEEEPLPYVYADEDPDGYYIHVDMGAEEFEELDGNDPLNILGTITQVYKTQGAADRALAKLQKTIKEKFKDISDEVWRFPIPEKMRDDLMTRGLPLLALTPVGFDEDTSLEDRATALGLGALAVVIGGKFGKTRQPAMAKLLEELARKPADLSRAAKKAGLTGTTEENALALFKLRGHTDSTSGMAQAMKDAGLALPAKTADERALAHAYVKEMLGRAASKTDPESPFARMSTEDLVTEVEDLHSQYGVGDRDDLNALLDTATEDLTEGDITALREELTRLRAMKPKR